LCNREDRELRKSTPEPLDLPLVIHAYAQGIFPMADQKGVIHWYASDSRALLEQDQLHWAWNSITDEHGTYERGLEFFYHSAAQQSVGKVTFFWCNVSRAGFHRCYALVSAL
jgi:hypothetical protein